MKSVAVFVCVFACACAAAPVADSLASVLRSQFDLTPEGNYHYGYETDNGIAANAEAKKKTVGKDEVLEVVGSNQYVGPDGVKYETTYVANENGYQVQGAHLPTPHTIPDYIVRSLEFIQAHPHKEEHGKF